MTRELFRLSTLLLFYCGASCAQGIITTIAGTDFTFNGDGKPALQAPIHPSGISVDNSENVFIADSGNNRVMKITPDGILTVIAGNGIAGFSGDGGPATSASLNSPSGLAVDSAGNVYFSDGIGRIRKVSNGIITTIAGNDSSGFSGDGGPATNATLASPSGLAVDSAGNLYIVDTRNFVIRKISGGIITTIAGNGKSGSSGDGGPATSASLNDPAGVAVDSAGNVYIADSGNYQIRRVSGGIITTFAGSGSAGSLGDGGPATNASLYGPLGVAVDSAGSVYIADGVGSIRKVSAGIITTVAGNGLGGFSGDGGPATSAFLSPTGVAVDIAGGIYIADRNNRIRKVSDGIITTIAGNGGFKFSGDGGPATSASLNTPRGVAVDSAGNVYIADTENRRIRKVSAGIITTIAGNGVSINSGDDGPATSLALSSDGVAVDSAGNVYIADTTNARIRKVSGGMMTTIAGGPATSTSLYDPTGVAVDSAGNVYIADRFAYQVRKLSGGIITTFAGNGTPGSSGDGGLATNASLTGPYGVAADSAGNVYVAEPYSNRIRKVSGGIITNFAGNGTSGFSGDGGPATSASLNGPYGVAVDSAGNVYIVDAFNSLIRKVSNGIITTIAGNLSPYFSGDGGPATSASISPNGVAVDSAGNVYIADLNDRIRVVLASPPAVQVSPISLSFSGQSNGAPAPAQSFSVASLAGVAFSTFVTSDGSWLSVTPQSGAAPRLVDVVADPSGLAPGEYFGTIVINTPNSVPASNTVAVTFTVTAGVPPSLSVDKPNLSFPFPRSGNPRSQSVTVSNSGGGMLPFSAAASTNTGGNWLSVSPVSGQALPATPAPLSVTADPTGLAPGTYTGQITVTAGTQSRTIPVTMTISTLDQAILLSQTGLSFTVVQSGGVVPSQSFAVLNIGTGVVNWSVSTSTLSGGPDWLRVTPAVGSTDASASVTPTVTVSVNGAALAPGKYYGLVQVDAPEAANTPQVLTVFLQVLPPDADVGAIVQPSELVFTTAAGAESPGSQNAFVYNIVPAAKSFRSLVSADPGLSLVTLPTDATLDPQQPTQIVVQPFTTNLGPGVHNGTLTLQFSDGRVSSVKVTVIVSSTAATGSSAGRAKSLRSLDSGAACTPTKLLPALSTLGQSFAVSAGWPVALGVDVKDDCGVPLDTGAVSVSFSNGDVPVVLTPLKRGRWEGTWASGAAQSQVTLKLTAENPQANIRGERQVSGELQSQKDPPVFDKSGVVSAADGQSFVALAPGSIISIYGDRLAENALAATSTPLPTELADTDVIMAGKKLPLYYVSQTQVNAVVPYGLNVNTTHQVLVRRGLTYSRPVPVDVAPAQPSVFLSGTPPMAPLIYHYPPGGSPPFQVTPASPAKAGDILLIYCAGLGLTNPLVTDGAAAPSSPPAQTQDAAQVTIGGVTAPVTFAGLVPGWVGLYEVDTVVPQGVQPGDQVAIVLKVSEQSSPQLTISVH